jgi:pSer/pThr/pTyr-binding forkhead associated (FHA) protein
MQQRTLAHGQPAVAVLRAASGRSHPLCVVATTIGRLADNDIVLDDASVSRHHAVIIDTGTNFVITDLRSANGVRVRQQRIRGSETLDDGDHVGISGQPWQRFHTGASVKAGKQVPAILCRNQAPAAALRAGLPQV